MVVYLITNLINNKKYVGYTQKSLEERIKAHLTKSKSKTNKHYFYLLPSAIRKYGIENFIWETIYETNNLKDVQEKEIYFIKTLNTISPNGYNLTEGGNGGIQSEETKIKISNSVKKHWDENKESHPWFNFDHEQRSEMAKKSWENKRKNGYVPLTGYTQSSESKKQMSDTKNEKNKVTWLNVKTNERIELSPTKMAEYTGLSNSIFNHLKNGRQKQTKCGWTYLVDK